MLPTLQQFLARRFPHNSYINDPRFAELYVRKTPAYLVFPDSAEGLWCKKTLTIARVKVKKNLRSKGVFKAFVKELVDDGYTVYVECCQVPRFAAGLDRMGFRRVNLHSSDELTSHHVFNYADNASACSSPYPEE